MSLRISAYRSFHRNVVERWVLPRVFSAERIRQAVKPVSVSEVSSSSARIWFHAASVGELESLWPVIMRWAEDGGELIVTVFSESARAAIERLGKSIAATSGKALFIGYSPWEGRWLESIRAVRPQVFVTAKYEAWPELWAALSLEKIPLVTVGARARRSFQVCRVICSFLGQRLPQMVLIPGVAEDAEPLRRIFPSARVEMLGEPRWDQVAKRARQGHPRARALLEQFSEWPRPWGVLGQTWPEDMDVWEKSLQELPGTVWVVPHRVERERVSPLMEWFAARGFDAIRTSEISEVEMTKRGRQDSSAQRARPKVIVPEVIAPKVIVVDEMGFLLELYARVDWAYIGGGFGAGVHSTIEPAIFGLPISCGPAGSHKFPEIDQLQKAGQLRVLAGAQQVASWLKGRLEVAAARRAEWRLQAEARQGATQSIHRLISELTRG